jgi:hypothetical protein
MNMKRNQWLILMALGVLVYLWLRPSNSGTVASPQLTSTGLDTNAVAATYGSGWYDAASLGLAADDPMVHDGKVLLLDLPPAYSAGNNANAQETIDGGYATYI